MKSYKDIDREIILNAPEGAMWYNHGNSVCCACGGGGVVYFSRGGGWSDSGAWFDLSEITEEPDAGDLIPLPNIEIPWEATADSVCPVPDGFNVKVTFDDGGDSSDDNPEGWTWRTTCHPITAYKIIDEEFLDRAKPAQEEPIHVPELEMHRAAYQAIKNAGFESPEELLAEHLAFIDSSGGHTDYEVLTLEEQLIIKLKFLQNLANEFPEIKDHAVKYMKEWLDYYVEDCIEEGE